MLVAPSQGATVSDLTVIVVSWNVSELLDRCLGSLHEALERDGLRARVWVVDNGSSDVCLGPQGVIEIHVFRQYECTDKTHG